MEPQQLLELADNAELDHWPPHLGVTTDAEKVEYLATKLREAAGAEARADELADQLETAGQESYEFQQQLEAANAEIYDLKEIIKELKAKLA